MPAPSHVDVAAYQGSLDFIVGTRHGRPIIKLAWAPDELRWYPYALDTEPRGYTFPIFHAYTDAEGQFIAAPRWVLLERFEPEQYGPTWETGRYSVYDGSVWDWKGPCPPERYIELRCHSAHDGVCCPCLGDTCKCGTDYDHCWGNYLDPNDRLLDWVRWNAAEGRKDSDVKPTLAANEFTAPRAQAQLKSAILTAQEVKQQQDEEFSNYMLNHWDRKPHSVSGERRTDAGIILIN